MRTNPSFLSWLAMALAALLLAGCTSVGMYRDDIVKGTDIAQMKPNVEGCKAEQLRDDPERCNHTSVEKTESYTLFFIELDEQGRFYDRRQLESLVDYLNSLKKPVFDGICTKLGDASIVTFVHGWRHNAQYDDANVDLARSLLSMAAYEETTKPHINPSCAPREIIGVYIGWRGLSNTAGLNTDNKIRVPDITLGLWEVITVIDRKNIAQNMAVGSAREVFGVLRAYQRLQNSQNKLIDASEGCKERNLRRCSPVRLLIVGHSYGGLIVYNAVAGQLIDSVSHGLLVDQTTPRAEDESKPCEEKRVPMDDSALVSSYADLIVLINPAVEGARYEALHEAVSARARKVAGQDGAFCPNQRPVLVSINAANDWANRYFFSVTRVFNTMFESDSPYNPNFTEKTRQYLGKEESSSSLNALGHVRRYQTHQLTGSTSAQTLCLQPSYAPSVEAAKENAAAAQMLVNNLENSPLWNIQVPRGNNDILKGHSQFNGVVGFIKTLYRAQTLENYTADDFKKLPVLSDAAHVTGLFSPPVCAQ